MITILLLIIGVLLIYLASQDKTIRRWLSGLSSSKSLILIVLGILLLAAVFYPRLNDKIAEIKRKLN